MSSTVQFPCQHCGSLMAVGPDLAGRDVRCPHCEQVVQAPAAADPEPPAALSPPPPEIAFRIEDTESIFCEGSDDELFAGPPAQIELPPEPAPENAPTWLVDAAPPTDSTAETDHPWPGPIEVEAPAPSPSPSPEGSAFAAPLLLDLQAIDVPNAPRPISTEVPDLAPAPVAPRRVLAAPPGRNFTNLALAILVPYALAMTFLTVWLAIRQSSAKPPSPLELLPDYGEQQDKTSKGRPLSWKELKLPPADTALSPNLKVKLGESIVVGQLQIVPERVVAAPAKLITPGRGDDEGASRQRRRDNLILSLRLKNVSSDVFFCPTDRVFDRRWDQNDSSSRPFTLLEVGSRKFYGGVLAWPPREASEEVYLHGQEHDREPLGPGQERETVKVVRSDYAAEALHYKQGPLVWRVHLRTGLTVYRGRELQSSAVVGVEFRSSDVQKGPV